MGHALCFDKLGGQPAGGLPRSRPHCAPRSGRTPPESCPGRRSAPGLHGCVREHASWTCPRGSPGHGRSPSRPGPRREPRPAGETGSSAPYTREVGAPGKHSIREANSRRMRSPGPGRRAGTQMPQSPRGPVSGAGGRREGPPRLWDFGVRLKVRGATSTARLPKLSPEHEIKSARGKGRPRARAVCEATCLHPVLRPAGQDVAPGPHYTKPRKASGSSKHPTSLVYYKTPGRAPGTR